MKNQLFSYLTCLLLIFSGNTVFPQQPSDTFELKIGTEVRAFTEQVQLVSFAKQTPVAIKDGNYIIETPAQKASLTISNKLINGNATIHKDGQERTDFVILNSKVQSLKTYTSDVLTVDIYKADAQLHFKEYYADQKVKSEGTMSLDKAKHYGRGITKWYDEQGKLQKIANEITETYTGFYDNGHKKSVSSPDVNEEYTEEGKLKNRQYSKNGVHYWDRYSDGKLYTRTYQNAGRNEITEYYNKGSLEKKEAVKTISGERRLLIYNKAGKLIDNRPYNGASPIN